MNFPNNLVAIFLPLANVIHDFTRGHRDFRRINAIGTKDRAAAALGTLVIIVPPIIKHFFGQILGANQPRNIFPGCRIVTTIDLTEQILTGNRHVEGISSPQKIVAFICTGPTFHARVEKDPQAPILPDHFTKFGNCFLLPIIDKLAGKTQRFLVFWFGNKWTITFHRPFTELWDLKRIRNLRLRDCFVVKCTHYRPISLRAILLPACCCLLLNLQMKL